MKLKYRLIYSFFILFLALVGLTGFSWFSSVKMAGFVDNMFAHPFVVSNTVRDIRIEIIDMHEEMHSLLGIIGQPQASDLLKEIDLDEQQILKDFEILGRQYLGNPQHISDFKQDFLDWKTLHNQILFSLREKKNNKEQLLLEKKALAKLDALNLKAKRVTVFADEKARQFHQHAHETATQLKRFLLGSVFLFVMLIFAFSHHFLRTILNPIYDIMDFAKALAKGQLDNRLKLTQKDEIGNLGQALNTMADALQNKALELENKVIERTASLTAANQQLCASEQQMRAMNQQLRANDQQLRALNQQLTASTQQLILNNKKLELQQREKASLNEQLLVSSKLASIGLLAAGVGHEINNPLAIALGNVEIIKTKVTDLPPIATMRLQKIETALHRITAIVKGLCTYARTKNNLQETADLHQILESTTQLLQEMLAKDNIRLTTKLSASTHHVHGDVGRLQQVFMNMITNARDACQNLHEAEITISTQSLGEDIRVKISDNGQGIPPENLDKIFDPFFTTKPVGQGTGLGLGISRTIIKNIGGEIDVDSKLGRGTTFIITLPSASACASADHRKTVEGLVTVPHFFGKVLIVDDEPDILDFISALLTKSGLEVEIASCGESALKKLQTFQFQFLITDLKMPNISGEQLLKVAREQNLLAHVKVIIISGCISIEVPSYEHLAKEKGAHAFLPKPFTPVQLYDTLTRLHS